VVVTLSSLFPLVACAETTTLACSSADMAPAPLGPWAPRESSTTDPQRHADREFSARARGNRSRGDRSGSVGAIGGMRIGAARGWSRGRRGCVVQAARGRPRRRTF
jgi:hypothetical protein